MNFQVLTAEKLLGSLNEVERKHAPQELYAAGNIALARLPKVSIVGTRNPSQEGSNLAALICQQLLLEGVCIVSGLAMGIDSVAHKTAIASGGKTIAVLGTPLNQTYPRENASLQQEIMGHHLAISQFHEGSAITRKNFPLRNRTMALISDATVIIEANEKSGTEHQGWEALRLGRPLFITALLAEKRLSWVDKLIYYGAQVLESDNISPILGVIPAAVFDEQSAVAL